MSEYAKAMFCHALSSRNVAPEWLDCLPAAHPEAIRSRRDLRRLNWILGHASALASVLGDVTPIKGANIRIIELGAGDGTFLLRVARRLQRRWPNVEALLVDRQMLVQKETIEHLEQVGWVARVIGLDVFDWFSVDHETHVDVIIGNLFLHHFNDDLLVGLMKAAAERCNLFVACEPRRSLLALWAARLLILIGCNAVTRHDAVVSVRAGFRERELAGLWPSATEAWRIHECPVGLFSHLFCARRTIGAASRC